IYVLVIRSKLGTYNDSYICTLYMSSSVVKAPTFQAQLASYLQGQLRTAQLAAGCGELELDVVGVPEGEHVDRHGWSQIRDLPMRDPTLVEHPNHPFKLIAARDRERQVIKTDAVLVETVPAGCTLRIRSRAEAEESGAVGEH